MESQRGVGRLVDKRHESLLESWKFISPLLLEVNIKPKGREIKLLIAYGLNEVATKEKEITLKTSYKLLQRMLNLNRK